MKLQELLTAVKPSLDLAGYRKMDRAQGMPPLDPSKISMHAVHGVQRFALSTPVEGDASLVLRYKGVEGAVSSIAELENGEIWNVLQFQGAKTSRSFRLTGGLDWRAAFASQIKTYASHPESDVREIAMPHHHDVTNLTGAASYENAVAGYGIARSLLNLRWSEERKLYVAEVCKDTKRSIIEVVNCDFSGAGGGN